MAAATPAPSCGLRVSQGACWVMFAFDVGFAIDLVAAERTAARVAGAEGAQREVLRHSRKSPRSFVYRPSPLRVARRGRRITIAGHDCEESVNATIYDFGAVSIAYAFPTQGELGALVALSEALYENEELLADARGHAEGLLALLGQAVSRPGLTPLFEDYVVFHARRFEREPGAPLAAWLDGAREPLAHILRSESRPLSKQERDEATGSVVAYGEDDVAIVDWNSALLLGEDMDDALAVLEFANVELLEMRFLDDRLDQALERARHAAARKPAGWFQRGDSASLREIAELQVGNALLFEEVNNTLKLLGDQYLARLYRAALQRFHLPDWDASILRKLGTLESIYEKLNDRHTHRRMEALEWIVILLIAFEVFAAWLWPVVQRAMG
jgi:hypothetical protein